MSELETSTGPEPPGFATDPEPRKAFYAAFAKAQGAIENAIKAARNEHFRTNYADLGAVWDACRKHLSENGIAVLQKPQTHFRDRVTVSVQTFLTHTGGHCEEFPPLELPVTKADAHGIGSAITYGRRFALAAAAGVAPGGDDDDGNAAVQPAPPGNGASAPRTNGASKSKPTRDLYTELQQDIDQAGDVDELQSWHGKRLNEIQSLPDDWRASLKDRYLKRLHELEADHVAA